MVDNTPSSPLASSKKARLIPSSFRKAGNLTNDQQTRLLRIQAAKVHLQDWETLALINYCLINNAFDSILGILYEYARCLDRIEKNFDIINESITKLQESIQTSQLSQPALDEIINSIVQAVKKISTTVCSIRRMQETPTPFYENNSKIIITPHITENESIFKLIEVAAQSLEKYCTKYQVDLSTLSPEQLLYIFAATSKINPRCNKKIVESTTAKELLDLITKLINMELKINAVWEKMDNPESLQYPTLKIKFNNIDIRCPSSLQFFNNNIALYDSLLGKLSKEFSSSLESPVAQLSMPLIDVNKVKSGSVKISNGNVSSNNTSKKGSKATNSPTISKKKENPTLPPTSVNKSEKQSASKKQPIVIPKQKVESKITPQNTADSKPIETSANVQLPATLVKEINSTPKLLPNAQQDGANDSSSSDDDNDVEEQTNQEKVAMKGPRNRSVSIAVMERSDSLAISSKMEDYSKKRRSTVVGSVAVDTVKESPIKRSYSIQLTQPFNPKHSIKDQRNMQDVLQTSVPFNPSRRNSSAKSLKSVSDVSSDDYDDAPYEDLDPEPTKTNYTTSSFDIGSMNSSFNYDAYDKASKYHYSSSFVTPDASPVRGRAQSNELINRTRSQSSEKTRGRSNTDDFNSPLYKQHKRQVSKTQELFSSISSLLSPYIPGASKAESQLIHLALRDLQSSGHTSGPVLVEMAAKKIAIWWSFVGPRLKLRRRMVIRNLCIEVINMCAYRAVSKSVSKRKRRFRWMLNHAALQIQKFIRSYMRRKYQGRQFNYSNTNNIPRNMSSHFARRRVNSNERIWSPLPSTPEGLSKRSNTEPVGRPNSGLHIPGSGVRPGSGSGSGSGVRPGSGATVNSGKSSDSGGKKTSSTEDKSSKSRPRTQSADDGSSKSRPRTQSADDGSSLSKGRSTGKGKSRTRQKSIISFSWLNKSPSARAWYAAILIQKVIRRYLAIARVDHLFAIYDDKQRLRDPHYQGSLWSIKHQYSSEDRKKIKDAVVTIQRTIRGKLARKRSFHIVKAGVLLNRKLNEFKSLKQLRMRLRRIERPLVIKLDNIYNIPNGIIRSENIKVVVSIWWSSLLHIVSELDFGTIIEGKKPQVQVKLENIPVLKQTPELLRTLNTYLETDSAIATEKKQYDRENLSKKKKSTILSFPSSVLKPTAVDSGGGSTGGHKRLGSILTSLETLRDDDGDGADEDSDSNSDVDDSPTNKKGPDSRNGSFLTKRFDGIRKTRISFLPAIRNSLSGLFHSASRRNTRMESSDILPACLDLQGRTIRIPGCHGNSVIKVEIYDDDRKIGNKVFFLSRHGGWLFWGGKYSEEIKLIGANRAEQNSRRNSTSYSLKSKINYVIKSGEALHSKAAQSIYVKIRGTGPAKLATRTKGLDFSFFEKKFPFYISLDYEDGLGLYHKKSNLEPFYVVPAKDIVALRLEQGQWVDGGSTMQDSHEIIISTSTYDEIIIRLDSVGNRVRWLEVFENILERNAAAILKFQQQNTLYTNITKLGKIFDRSPKNQGPIVRRLRGGLQ